MGCAKLKNVCQTCILDLEYGLPIQVRDAALRIKDDLPKSDVNREYYIQNADRELANNPDYHGPAGTLGKISSQKSEMLQKLARTTPYYKRNRAHICSFWVKGECRRGEECPYRHEKPSDPDDPLSVQNIVDRFYGTKDPVADKLLRRAEEMPSMAPPEDKTITTLWCGGVTSELSESDLQEYFYQFGEVACINIVQKSSCAFVQFTKRESAENAANKCYGRLDLKGVRLNVRWGKPQQSGAKHHADIEKTTPVPGLPGPLPNPGKVAQYDPSKRAKPAESVPKPMSEPIDLPAMGAMGAPRAPSDFAGPDKGGNSGFQKIHYPSQSKDRMGSGKYAHMAPPSQYTNANAQKKPGQKRAASDWN